MRASWRHRVQRPDANGAPSASFDDIVGYSVRWERHATTGLAHPAGGVHG
ncbi:hypothetical protein [Candidatus Macondimonas diazotrophica]|jgi:hypothetical protein|nr:hypothetical protein [Candidatus Macondimonas diazotrophica]NCU00191.1 hypothetical protein [Candidatus Macondimonas diazotrophica]